MKVMLSKVYIVFRGQKMRLNVIISGGRRGKRDFNMVFVLFLKKTTLKAV